MQVHEKCFCWLSIDKVIEISASLSIQFHYLFGEISWNRAEGVELREIYCNSEFKEFGNQHEISKRKQNFPVFSYW